VQYSNIEQLLLIKTPCLSTLAWNHENGLNLAQVDISGGSSLFFVSDVCPNLVFPVHLVADGVGILVGTVVSFKCDEGWHVEGAFTISCLPGRRWSADVPTCVEGGEFVLLEV
jgi:hypothetical protein